MGSRLSALLLSAGLAAATAPEVIIHVGPHKTGSTTLQAALVANPRIGALLRRDNYAVPRKFPGAHPGPKNHANLVLALRSSNMTAHPTWVWFEAYVRRAFAAGKHLLLSSENLSTLDVPGRLEALVKMLRTDVGFRVRVVVVYRRLFDKLPSLHSELFMSDVRPILEPAKYFPFLEWLRRGGGEHTARHYQGTIQLRDRFARLGVAEVAVINMHAVPNSSSLTAQFVCEHMRAPRTCAELRSRRLPTPVKNAHPRNLAPLYDIVYSAALARGMGRFDPGEAVRALLERGVLTDPALAIPLRCLDGAERAAILGATVAEETELFTRGDELGALEAAALRAAFAAKATAYCGADVHAVLQVRTWDAPVTEALDAATGKRRGRGAAQRALRALLSDRARPLASGLGVGAGQPRGQESRISTL
jgi:hypothetical protein